MKHVVVLGGTGAVGGAVARAARKAGARVTLTYCTQEAKARSLAEELKADAHRLDVRDSVSVRAFVDLAGKTDPPAAWIYCVGVLENAAFDALTEEAWDASFATNARGPFVALRSVSSQLCARGGGNVVIVGGLDRSQSLPIPVAYAATQGALAALVMSSAKELGPKGIRVNMVALGLLSEGLSQGLSATLREDYVAFSALRRLGSPSEAARAIVWLALENTYVTGKVIAVNGGI